MAERQPFVLLDDARETGAADALLFENPRRVFVAHRPEQVARALADADDARREGGELAGYIAYEAGLALEDRLADRAAVRSGGSGKGKRRRGRRRPWVRCGGGRSKRSGGESCAKRARCYILL